MKYRTARIITLLVIDICFFFVELIVGYAVGSLALVADSFHMLNDVLSLFVALYAIKLTKQTHFDSRYSYGWHRAEILAALVNGVFLCALCFTIFLEAMGRFFSTPEITNPKLIVVVGSLGLASNIVGLFLFHEHDHGEVEKVPVAVSGPPLVGEVEEAERPSRDVSPKRPGPKPVPVRERSDSYSSMYGHPAATRASMVQAAEEIARARSPSPVTRKRSRPGRSRSRARVPDFDEIHIEEEIEISPPGKDRDEEERREERREEVRAREEEPREGRTPSHKPPANGNGHVEDERTPLLQTWPISEVEEAVPRRKPTHGSMNMRALLLHVFGDALGNVGVIATGLVIWLTEWKWKYYFDPVISLVIAVIIFSSAMPLVRSTSFILLQGVPSTISLDEVRDAILDVDGVLSLHELHVWQLSENKIVASVHVRASRTHDFMPVASRIRKALHERGIHSSTIQPEYHAPGSPPDDYMKTSAETSCLIQCPPDQNCDPNENACCPRPPAEV